jgi:hypothetical protein
MNSKNSESICECDGFAMYLNQQVQSHNVFDYLLERAGHAERMIISSFAITEAYVRRIIRNREHIDKIDLILDFTIASRNPRITMYAAQNVDNLYLVNNHSKIIYVETRGQSMAAVMSNNATNNHRFESGVIISDSCKAQTFGEAFELVIQQAVRYG